MQLFRKSSVPKNCKQRVVFLSGFVAAEVSRVVFELHKYNRIGCLVSKMGTQSLLISAAFAFLMMGGKGSYVKM